MTITEFLLARIAEDEEQAHRSLADHQRNPNLRIPAEWVNGVVARVLAECEAKRRIVEQYRIRVAQDADEDDWGSRQITTARCEELESVLRLLAKTYADHPDFDPAWRV